MNSEFRSGSSKPLEITAAQAISKEARRLHRASVSGALADALPILRRLIATESIRDQTLPELNRQRETIRRKHILRMLAVEAGFSNWENYRKALGKMQCDELPHFEIASKYAGSPNCWYSTFEEALEHAANYGGRPIRLGRQGVVVPE